MLFILCIIKNTTKFASPSKKGVVHLKEQVGAVAQLVEHRTENPGVAGSIPARTTNN